MSIGNHPSYRRRKVRGKGIRNRVSPESITEMATATHVSTTELATMAKTSDRALLALVKRIMVFDSEES